ncbi:11141_t:CDS:2, partial [Rhizophagus irregularis]
KWIDNLKIVPIGGITSHMTYGQTDLDNLFLREQFFGRFPRLSEKISVFLECMIAFLDASWNIDSKVDRLLEAKFAIVC